MPHTMIYPGKDVELVRFAVRNAGREAPGWLLPFFIGFIAGVLLMNAGFLIDLEKSSLLDEYTLGRLKYMEINCNTFFLYVLQKRMTALWLLLLFCITAIGIYVLFAYLAWSGFALGTLLSAAVIRYGIKGILLLLAGAFPHYLLYVPACLMLLQLGQNIHAGKKNILQCGMGILVLHVVVIIGVLLESYVNPFMVTRVLKIF